MEFNKNHKLSTFTMLMALSFVNQAHAGPWEDIGHAWGTVTQPVRVIVPVLEKGAQTLGKATADVVTLGGAGRDRDLAEAQKAKQIAEINRQNAETLAQQRVEMKKFEISHTKAEINSTENLIGILGKVKGLLEGNQNVIFKVIELYSSGQMENDLFRVVASAQHGDLVLWLDEMKRSVDSSQRNSGNADKNGQVVINEKLIEKINMYNEQLKNIPHYKMPSGQFKFNTQELVTQNSLIIASIEKVIGILNRNLLSENAQLIELEANVKVLHGLSGL